LRRTGWVCPNGPACGDVVIALTVNAVERVELERRVGALR
jgi:hypothetical protein